jgi:hypothetical protein
MRSIEEANKMEPRDAALEKAGPAFAEVLFDLVAAPTLLAKRSAIGSGALLQPAFNGSGGSILKLQSQRKSSCTG